MSGSIYGKLFSVSTWGESHGKALGVVIDGCPAGVELCEEDIQKLLDRRKPGQSRYVTQRKESDSVEILSGVFEGKTTGTPISLIVKNESQRSADYSEIASYYRPGHADYTFDEKYGFRDYRGGGRSSGRETIGRVAAGAVALKILDMLNIKVYAYAAAIGGIEYDRERFSMEERDNNPFAMPDAVAAEKIRKYADEKLSECNSMGGIIECVVENMPAGIGEPVFDKLDANLAKVIMSIGAVKGFEIGDGFKVAASTGLENNDAFRMRDGRVVKATNHAGGILGGMSDGSDIILRAAVKPTPSIASMQQTVNKKGEEIDISIHGRHDPMIVPRAVVVVEAMTAITLVDMLFMGMTSRIDRIVDFYKKAPSSGCSEE